MCKNTHTQICTHVCEKSTHMYNSCLQKTAGEAGLYIYIHTYIHCSQKVGDIWTLKLVALTKTMTRLKQPVLIRQIYLKTICVKVWKFHPGTWLQDHNVRTRDRLPIFTWIGHDDRIFQDVGMYTDTFAIVHFLSWKFCFAYCDFKLRNARHKRDSFSVKRRICLNFVLCASPRDSAFDMRKMSGAYRI